MFPPDTPHWIFFYIGVYTVVSLLIGLAVFVFLPPIVRFTYRWCQVTFRPRRSHIVDLKTWSLSAASMGREARQK